MNIEIKDATSGDVEGIWYVTRESWLDTYPNEEYGVTREEIEQKYDRSSLETKAKLERRREVVNTRSNHHEWVAKTDNKVVGWCYARSDKGNLVQALYILPEYQNQGIGSKLLKEALGWFDPKEDVFLGVVVYNQKAMNFYTKFGFIKTGKDVEDKETLPHLSSDKVIPSIEMVKQVRPVNPQGLVARRLE